MLKTRLVIQVSIFLLVVLHTLSLKGLNQSVLDTNRNEKTTVLKELIVEENNASKNLHSPNMGSVDISNKYILNLPSLLAEPDIIRTLHVLPGVSPGIEGFTGMYVHGGEDDQNLFLFQNLPLYGVSHFGGIFSSFNAAAIDGMKFYKTSFPAQYGGRISSITDIKSKRPNLQKTEGQISVGLLSANGYISIPLKKDRTGISLAMRRSWLELITVPALAIINSASKKDGEKKFGHYNFTDFNLRLDHKFNTLWSLSISGYLGYDDLKIGTREFPSEKNNYSSISFEALEETDYYDQNSNTMRWGNWGGIGSLKYRNKQDFVDIDIYYTSYSSKYKQEREYQTNTAVPSTYGVIKSAIDNSVSDLGISGRYNRTFETITLKAGIGYIYHSFLPEKIKDLWYKDENLVDRSNHWANTNASEASTYLECSWNPLKQLSFDLGARLSMFGIDRKQYWSAEPRASVRLSINKDLSIKAGYSRSSQCVQQISNNYINLPTDIWVPVSKDFSPLRSDQFAIGLYGNLPLNMYFSAEGWYKNMTGVLEYKEGVSELSTDLNWNEKLTSGKGWAYGLDLLLKKDFGKISGSLGYGLMWNWRKFNTLNNGMKFPAKFDNRHKFNLNLVYKPNEKFDFSLGFIYMSGNRLTLALFNYETPTKRFPGSPSILDNPDEFNFQDTSGVGYTPERNNFRLPNYNRLDLGMNIYKNYKNGSKGIWNISLYNTYCRMNALTVVRDLKFVEGSYGKYRNIFSYLSLLPTIPSFSYTHIF